MVFSIRKHRDRLQFSLLRSEDGKLHFTALDSLRGICACMVVMLHFTSDAILNNLVLVQHAFLFVDFFFVLSGFVMAESYERKLADGLSVGRFMALRVGRLVPLHAAVLIALLALSLVAAAFPRLAPGGGEHSISGFLASLALVQIWVPRELVEAWNGPSWSVSAEIWTYLLFAGVVSIFGRYRLLVCLVSVLIAPVLMGQASDRHINVCYEGAIARSVYSFSLGVLCNHLRYIDAKAQRHDAIWSIVQFLAVFATGAVVYLVGSSIWSYLAPWFFAVTIFVLARKEGLVSRLLCLRPFVKLGLWSYSIYLTHVFVQARISNLLALVHWRMSGSVGTTAVITRVSPFPYASDVLTIIMLCTTIAVAALSFRFIEEPGRIWSRSLFGTAGRSARSPRGTAGPAR